MTGFEDLNIEQLYAAVSRDDPDALHRQAGHWDAIAAGLTSQADALHGHIGSISDVWTSDSREVYLEQLRRRRNRLADAADLATANAASWRQVATSVSQAQSRIGLLHQEWQGVKPLYTGETEQKNAREEFDVAGRAVLDDAVTQAGNQTIAAPEPYEPMPHAGPDDDGGGSPDQPSGDDRPVGEFVGSNTGYGAAKEGGFVGPTTREGPELESAGTPFAPPAPAPSGPAPVPPPGGGPVPPVGPVLPTPPTRGPIAPVPRPVAPIGRAPGATPSLRPAGGPRPPQSTVRPVIGSRPGGTGRFGAGGPPVRTGQGYLRPVIGARPGGFAGRETGAAPGARYTGSPTKSLIGRDGVVGSGRTARPGVRVPKTYSGGSETNRSVVSGTRQAFRKSGGRAVPGTRPSRERDETPQPSRHHEGGDYIWTTTGTTVPSVITGTDWSCRDHTAGPTPELRADPTQTPTSDDREVVQRLSRTKDTDPATELWTGEPSHVRAVITGSTTKRDDGWGPIIKSGKGGSTWTMRQTGADSRSE